MVFVISVVSVISANPALNSLFVAKPLTSTLLTSTFVFRFGVPLQGVRTQVVFSGDFPGRAFCH